MPSEATREVVPTRGNTPGGQRSPGHWVANEPGPWEDMTGTARSNLPSGGRSWWRTSRPEGKPMGRCTTHLPSPTTWVASWSSRRGGRQTTGARGVCGSALKLPPRWAGLFSDKWCAEPRSEPDSGNPTVRDRRAALRTVTSHASGVLVRALNFEPDNRTHGLTWRELESRLPDQGHQGTHNRPGNRRRGGPGSYRQRSFATPVPDPTTIVAVQGLNSPTVLMRRDTAIPRSAGLCVASTYPGPARGVVQSRAGVSPEVCGVTLP
jgi:hypothetical protein